MIIRTPGDLSDFSIHLNPITEDNILLANGTEKKNYLSSYREAEKSISTLAVMEEVSRSVDNYSVQLKRSKEARGLGLKSIHLNRSFEIFLANMFRTGNEIFFMTWSWDLSGEPVFIYPTLVSKPEEVIFRLQKGDTFEFMGTGIAKADKGRCIQKGKSRLSRCDGHCYYFKQVEEAEKAAHTLFNFSSFLFQRHMVDRFKKQRELLRFKLIQDGTNYFLNI